jgi:hypothetical protein
MGFEPLISNRTGRDTTGLGVRPNATPNAEHLPVRSRASEPEEAGLDWGVDVEFEALWKQMERAQRT